MTEILFNEAEHKYYTESGDVYTSVTTLIGKYTNPFDEEFWGMYTCLKNHNYKVKPQPETRSIYVNNVLYPLINLMRDTRFKNWYDEIIAHWRGLNFEACERGNQTHNELELSINQSKSDMFATSNNNITPSGEKIITLRHELDGTPIAEKYPEVHARLSAYLDRGFSIFAEKRVFLQEYKLAGMIDCPVIKSKHFCILDWKTNKDTIKEQAGYYKKINVGGKWIKSDNFIATGETFKYPLDMLEASKFNTMALQLSTYAFILEQWGYIFIDKGLEIIHFPVGAAPRLLKLPYLKNEVQIMLNHHKQSFS